MPPEAIIGKLWNILKEFERFCNYIKRSVGNGFCERSTNGLPDELQPFSEIGPCTLATAIVLSAHGTSPVAPHGQPLAF
jgi:hypothetical protein